MFCSESIYATYPPKKWGRQLFRSDIKILFDQEFPERKELPHIIRYAEKARRWYVYELLDDKS